MNIQAIILLGSPGSGKDTQAELLAKRYGFFQFKTSKLLRDLFASQSDDPVVQKEQALYQSGALNTPAFATELVMKTVTQLAPTVPGIIFNGSPRTYYEVERIYPFFETLFGPNNIRTFYIYVRPEEVVRRNGERLMCTVCGSPFIMSAALTVGVPCPNGCGGTLQRRDLDKPEIVRQRIHVFEEETQPVIDYFRERGMLIQIDGEQSIEKVQEDIVAKLQEK